MRPAEEEPTNGRERRALARRREAAEERREAARRKLVAPTVPLGASRFGEMCDVLGKLMANNEQFGVDGIKKSQNLWIVKPDNENRGRGIEIISTWKDFVDFANGKTKQQIVMQKYVEKPMVHNKEACTRCVQISSHP